MVSEPCCGARLRASNGIGKTRRYSFYTSSVYLNLKTTVYILILRNGRINSSVKVDKEITPEGNAPTVSLDTFERDLRYYFSYTLSLVIIILFRFILVRSYDFNMK